jgi:hypothetical protein
MKKITVLLFVLLSLLAKPLMAETIYTTTTTIVETIVIGDDGSEKVTTKTTVVWHCEVETTDEEVITSKPVDY